MRYIVNLGFALATTLLFIAAAWVIIHGAWTKEGYAPGDAETLFGLASGALTAFIVAQLGLAAGNDSTGTRNSLKAAMSGAETRGNGDAVLALAAIVFVVVGLLYVWAWIDPGRIPVAKGEPELTAAPEFISVHAKAFVGIIVAGFGALASTVKP